MSDDPYLEGRHGGGPPPSGPDFGEWSRGNQDRLKGLQQNTGDSTGPLLGDEADSGTRWPQPPLTFSGGENSESGGGSNPYGFTVDSGCVLVLLAALALLLLPLALVTWMRVHPLSTAALGHWFAARGR